MVSNTENNKTIAKNTFYLYLRLKEELCQRDMMFEFSLSMTTDEVKSMFRLGDHDYMDDVYFHRSKFEKRFLIPSVEEISDLDKSLSLSWEKLKENRLVTGYLFKSITGFILIL